MVIKKIKGVVKNYDWGNTDFIPSLIGGYDGKPQAELWFGTHPSGPSTFEDGGSLKDALEADRSILGEKDWQRYQGKCPVLYKVLAIASQLSLQCHPTKAQAVEGWEREAPLRAAGAPYNYQDDNSKAEILSALTPVTALNGFRPLEESREALSALLPKSYPQLLEPLMGSVRDLFLGLYALTEEQKESLLEELKESLEASAEPDWDGEYLTRKGIAAQSLWKHPGDIGALFPFIMNVMHLSPGEAVFLVPDTLHAYVYGNGVELMDASDNVLRGGLTAKRVDLEELKRIMSFEAGKGRKVEVVREADGLDTYKTPGTSFTLRHAGKGSYKATGRAMRFCLVIEGNVTFTVDGMAMALEKGECAVIPAELGEYAMEVTGSAYFAEVAE